MRLFFLIYLVISSHFCWALSVRPDAPARYEVKSGDTLWSIASRYLEKPWEWQTLWRANPQIQNPDHLYPGAIIVLRHHHNAPYLHVLSNGTVKLSPKMEALPPTPPVPPIHLNDIKPFLDASLILDKNILKRAPYVLAFQGEHLIGGQGDEVYVKDLCPPQNLPAGQTLSYAIYRPNGKYYDIKNKKVLGYKATIVGYAEYIRGQDPATIMLTNITEGVKLRDKVLPDNQPYFDLNFYPKAPTHPIQGRIIDIQGDYNQGAVGLVTVLDRGKQAGLMPGDVLAVFTRGRILQDPNNPKGCIHLPEERIGEVMVFKTFTHTSFALVMRSTSAIQKKDFITNP